MKNAPASVVADQARSLLAFTKGTNTRLIINDDPALAAVLGADGVHIGQNDLPYDQTRTIVGPEAIIGVSTHNPGQTKKACEQGPNYIGVGPVFATPTKKMPDPVIGITGMQEMLTIATVPAVAIGGIDLSNLEQVLDAGAKNVCMVRAVNQSQNPGAVMKKALRMLECGGRR